MSKEKTPDTQQDTLQELRDLAKKNNCGSMAAKMKNGEIIILITADSLDPQKDLMTATLALFSD